MSHKGYTLVNLIAFFQNTTNAQFKHLNALELADGALTGRESFGRGNALDNFLGYETWAINDGLTKAYRALGKTPRTRILRALRNRKRTGNVLGTT